MPNDDEPPLDPATNGAHAPAAVSSGTGPDGSLPEVDPDAMEEVNADEIDNIVPTFGYHRMPVVALGGSAGSIQALKSFLQSLPPRTGMVYVVIVHLSPEHESTLPSLLQAVTPMPVSAAQDGEKMHADHVYVIPRGKHLTVINGHLKLNALEFERGRRVAVDLFFRSLADTHGPHATAIVLSGADGDGAVGIKRVKERGGLTIAQEPDEAEHDSMPRAAISTTMVDLVLRVAEMPARILQYRDSEARLRLPAEDGPQPALPLAPSLDQDEQALRETLVFLRTRTSHDFTYYKRATILRRISRRMQINAVTTLPNYLAFLRTHPGEAGALLQDLLISVTNFFRDREAFAAVEQEIPGLFADKGPSDVVRVWCAACATGEEVYSFAIMLVEHARTLDNPPTIQVFGCDLDSAAIQTARAGIYPPSIVADVTEERIARFFTKDTRGYRVRRELREMVLFAEHDLLKDAPFSRMDLISCRNLLIYFDREAQDKAMDIFHFALRPEGRLFLGNSETVDETRGLFTPLDKRHRIYVRRPAPRLGLPVPTGTGTLLRALQAETKEAPVVSGAVFTRGPVGTFNLPSPAAGGDERAALTELHFKLLERLAPPAAVINGQQDIVHLSEQFGRFLQVVGGPPTMNLLRMIHPALRTELRAAIFRAADAGGPVDVPGLAVQLEGAPKVVDLRVTPAPDLAPGHLVVTCEARDLGRAETPNAPARTEAESVVRHLERDVENMRGQLRDTVERYEASAEEYRASNEELQAMNEELRSASEELETSREELQSINEELNTVNLELKARVEEVGQVNGDLQNFLSATDIATVFLDRELRVMRYTQASVGFFNLIPGDTGRPLADLKFQVDYPELIPDAQEVLRKLVLVEREVGKAGGGWYLARLLPYRTTDDRIGGVVLTFLDITARKRAEVAQRQSEEQFRSFVAVTSDSIYKMSPDWSEMHQLYGKKFLADTANPTRTWLESYIPAGERPAVLVAIREAIAGKRPFELEHRIVRADGSEGWTLSRAIPLLDERGELVEWFGAAQDVTERRRAGEALQNSLQESEVARGEAEATNRSKDQFLAVLSHELRTPLTPVVMALGMLRPRTDLPGIVRDALEMIERNVRIETRFIDDLLDMTRISRGQLEIASLDTDVHEAVGRAVEITAADFAAKEQTLTVRLDAAETHLRGDMARLQQVFWNLLKNASKFTPEQGRIALCTRNDAPGRVAVEVTDTGIGWEPGATERIFRPFEQADASIAGEFGGLGLGLSIAKATVEAHGGELRGDSPGRGQGATLTVDLPVGRGSA